MILTRVLSLALRAGEFISSVVVMGILAYYIDHWRKGHQHINGRFIYSLVTAVLGTLFALIWLIPTTANVAFHAVGDFILSIMFFAAFGLIVNWFGADSCGGVFHWGGITSGRDDCSRWKAIEAFSFLAAIFFLVSALLALWVGRGERRTARTTHHHGRHHV